MTKVLSGTEVSLHIKESLKNRIKQYDDKPGLAVILVGDNPASKVYVNHKKKVCQEIGIESFEYLIKASEGQSKLEEVLDECNSRSDIHGVLLQLPLPDGFNEQAMLERIKPEKDVDGFHPMNVGKLLIGLDTFKSCTPYGVMKILEFYQIDPSGKHVVIVGRSNIVGKPLAAMLVQKEKWANATVTICHSRTEDLKKVCQTADILVAAIGIPEFITKDYVKKDAVVIDVGINRIEDLNSNKKSRLVGDVKYTEVAEKSSAITPVPGGVGPMTIAMLMSNTIKAFEDQMN